MIHAFHEILISMDSMNDLKQTKDNISVLMVAFPLQGHLNQLLHLSRLISAYTVSVHFAGTTTHNRQAKRRFICHKNDISNIIFHDFPLPPYDSPPPNPNSPVKFPSHLQPLIDASSHLRHPVSDLMRMLSATSKRLVIICDSMMGSVVQDFVSLPNAEMYTFHCLSAFTVFLFVSEKMGRPFTNNNETFENVPTMENCFTPEFAKFIGKQNEYVKLCSGRIYNTCRVIEGKFLDFLSKEVISGNKKQWAIGPFNPVNNIMRGSYDPLCHDHKCLNWLDRQAPNSVIFVSFGTTTLLSDVQVKELAVGLENSQQKFIWVLREADRGTDEFSNDDEVEKNDRLPKGFENRVEDRGVIVRDWAPQMEILGHFAVGGFMSHCGWNSCMESVSMGVPIAAWPMHSDQPRNAVLITKVMKVGVVVKDWDRGRDGVVESSMVESVVRRLMSSQEGEEIRKRAAELGGRVRSAVAEGGATCVEFDSFISHITR